MNVQTAATRGGVEAHRSIPSARAGIRGRLLSATAFNHAIHLLGTAALVFAAAGLLRLLSLSSNLKTAILAALAIVHFGNLRFFDRQEELALIFVWLELGVWLRFGSAKAESPFAPRKEPP